MPIIVKPIKKEDIPSVRFLDNHGDFDVLPLVKDTLENNEKQYDAYGAFVGNIMAGYCTICGAETLEFEEGIHIEFEDQMLSDVFILEPFRHMGYGTEMVKEILKKYEKHKIFIIITNNKEIDYYSKLGFVSMTNSVMVKNPTVIN